MKATIEVRYTAWLWFCPVYLPDIDLWIGLAPIPRGVPPWLLDSALAWQNGLNWLMSWVDEELCGFLVFHVCPLPMTKMVTVDVEGGIDLS